MQIRYYAGAADAAGTASDHLEAGDLTAAELVARLGQRDQGLADVLACCSVLVDGSPVRDDDQRIPEQARVDFLPPVAGG